MLVLARRVGERILIGDQIAVTVVKTGPASVRIGVEAPAEFPVVREELAQEIAAQEAAKAAQASDEQERNEKLAGEQAT